eukprot:g2135.t1
MFAGHDAEIKKPGEWFSLQIGKYPIVVVRGKKGELNAFHNVCRHRGFRICKETHGKARGRKLVCPYHQWTYDVDSGSLAYARDMPPDFDGSAHGLKRAHVESVEGLIYVNVSSSAPKDFGPVRELKERYAEPFDFANAKIAFQERTIEKGNFKIVMENNRECYHCAKCHPELDRSFPSGPSQNADSPADIAFAKACERDGYPALYRASEDKQFRAMKLDFVPESYSMTMDGALAVKSKMLGRMPPPSERRLGTTLFYHYPSTWQHWMADHAVTFRVLPIDATTTELVSTWLVHADAEEGVDYDLSNLTEVWKRTNEEDKDLVEGTQAGVASPAYVPGPYNALHETGVIEFVDWFSGVSVARLSEKVESGERERGEYDTPPIAEEEEAPASSA